MKPQKNAFKQLLNFSFYFNQSIQDDIHILTHQPYIYLYFSYLQFNSLNYQKAMYIENPSSQIKKKIHLDCPLCYNQYDDQGHIPMMICPNQHNCCNQCLDRLFIDQQDYESVPCPDCRQSIYRQNATKFRLLNDIRQTATQLNSNNNKIKQLMLKLREDKNSLIQELQIQKKWTKQLAAKHKIQKETWQKKYNDSKTFNKGNQIKKNTTRQKIKNIITKKLVTEKIYYNAQNELDSNYIGTVSMYQTQKYKQTQSNNPEYDLQNGERLKSKMNNSKRNKQLPHRKYDYQISKNTRSYSKRQQRQINYSFYGKNYEKPVDNMINKKIKAQRCKSMTRFKAQGKISLPYFILNQKFIQTINLISIGFSQTKQRNFPRRQMIISILKRYDFTQLLHLNLQNAELRNIHFLPLQNNKKIMPNLQVLNLKKNKLQSFPLVIFTLNSLRQLNLSYNYIDEIPSGIERLHKLKSLQMWNNRLTGLPVELSFLSELQYLQLSNNKLTELPYFLYAMTMINKIDIFGNQIDQSSISFEQFLEMCSEKNIKVIHDLDSLTSES